MLGNKIDELNSPWKATNKTVVPGIFVAPVYSLIAGAFLCMSGCFVTKAQGDRLHMQVQNLEDEVAKLQRVRHDMEVLLVGQVKDLIDRMARIERGLSSLRESLTEGSSKSTELVAEIQILRQELDQAKEQYKSLEVNQHSLAKNQQALKEVTNKIRIPPLKEDHFALAKKLYLGGQFDEATFLFEQLVKSYPDEKDLASQSYYLLGEIYRKLGDAEKSKDDAENYYKKSIVSYQKITEMYKDAILREEALFKMGSVLKQMGNTEGAKAALQELLTNHQKSKRAAEAKALLVELEGKKP